MEEEQARAKRMRTDKVVKVSGFGSEWSLPQGVTVQDALQVLSTTLPGKPLVLWVVNRGQRSLLPFTFQLEGSEHLHYFVEPAVPEVRQTRRFGAGHAVHPTENYYVPPTNVSALVAGLKNGKYCVLCDRRQSGKTTTAKAVMRVLERETRVCPVYITVSAKQSWTSSEMWFRICYYLYCACPSLFPEPTREQSHLEDSLFLSYFDKRHLHTQVTIILDEADNLLELGPACLSEFFQTIKRMKDDKMAYNIHGFLLVGVETVKDLLEAQYQLRKLRAEDSGRQYVAGSSPSRFSPFPHDHRVSSSMFTIEDIVDLLQQANKDLCGIIRDVEEIAASVLAWTSGHKGLVGTCLAYLCQEEAFSLRAWLRLSDSYDLGLYIWGQATYAKIIRFFRRWASANREVAVQFIEQVDCDYDDVDQFRELLAEGVVTADKDPDGLSHWMRISSPILRSAILRRLSVVGHKVSVPPPSKEIDRLWVILETVRTLNIDNIDRPESSNVTGITSEYAHQFAFMCRLKAVLQGAYPDVHTVVLPEVKEQVVRGARRSRMRLDTLVRDKEAFPKFGFEYVVEADMRTLEQHLRQANTYHLQHSAQVFLVHVTRDRDGEEVQPDTDGVTFVGVRLDRATQTATVKTWDVAGERQVHQLQLKNWTGRYNFDEL